MFGPPRARLQGEGALGQRVRLAWDAGGDVRQIQELVGATERDLTADFVRIVFEMQRQYQFQDGAALRMLRQYGKPANLNQFMSRAYTLEEDAFNQRQQAQLNPQVHWRTAARNELLREIAEWRAQEDELRAAVVAHERAVVRRQQESDRVANEQARGSGRLPMGEVNADTAVMEQNDIDRVNAAWRTNNGMQQFLSDEMHML